MQAQALKSSGGHTGEGSGCSRVRLRARRVRRPMCRVHSLLCAVSAPEQYETAAQGGCVEAMPRLLGGRAPGAGGGWL